MKKILFLIHDLGQGGAEKVLVNLVNHMDRTKFDITVCTLFGGGVNEPFLAPHIKHYSVWQKTLPGNSRLMKLLTPAQLHRLCVKDTYDIEVSYLEGPSARVISGCQIRNTKLVCWIHSTQHSIKQSSRSFRSFSESRICYERFDRIIAVSSFVKQAFESLFSRISKPLVLYNTNNSDLITEASTEQVEDTLFSSDEIRLVGVGKITENKGFDRLARIHRRLKNAGYPVHTYILGRGADQKSLEAYVAKNSLGNSFTFLGYQTNPYKYVAHCDLFVCSSYSEGFSTAATEALIVGTPVCTVEVSGMKEMLGENNEYGVVTENSEDALYEGIKTLLDDPALLAHYKEKAAERGQMFRTEETVRAVEDMLLSL